MKWSEPCACCFCDSFGIRCQSDRNDSCFHRGWIPPHLIVGKEDGTSDQIKFRLSDCVFEYGDFRDADAEDFGAHKFEGFLVVGSKNGDTLSLFEPKS